MAPAPDVDRAARAAAAHAHAGGSADLVAPMPGAVLTVHVSPGDPVDTGDPIITLEAMKMNTYIYAPKAGKVAAVLVNAGDGVEEGSILLSID